jgi:hypothetical protein
MVEWNWAERGMELGLSARSVCVNGHKVMLSAADKTRTRKSIGLHLNVRHLTFALDAAPAGIQIWISSKIPSIGF